MYAEPIFSAEGGFPKELSERVAQKSRDQGFYRSRMPTFTEEEKAFVRGTYDFFGVNHYTSFLVSANEYKSQNVVPSLMDDIDVGTYVPDEWPKSASGWLTVIHKLSNIQLTVMALGWMVQVVRSPEALLIILRTNLGSGIKS